MKNKIEEMLLMQNDLNTKTCGDDWTSGTCKKTGKPINWDLAILDECAELLGSTDFKWWKHGEDDVQNQRLEIVDIWHFLMSSIIENDVTSGSTVINSAEHIEKVATEAVLEPSMDSCILGIIDSRNSNILKVQYMFIIMSKIGMSFDQLYSLYMAKNWLNEFRMNNGYKDGTYIKEWKLDEHKPAMEDNDILQSLIGTLGLDSAKITFELRYNVMLKETNLCFDCKKEFLTCTGIPVIPVFGDRIDNDNVVKCDSYEK